jgi:histidinol-phosphate aminotransferase
MTPLPLTRIVASLDTRSAFLGGKALERLRGRPFRARLGANESLFGVSPRVREAWAHGLDNIGHYNDPTHHELRSSIAQRWGVDVGCIGVAEGIDALLELLVRAIVETGDSVVTSLGAYPTFDYHAAGYGARIHRVPYQPSMRNDLPGLARAAHQSGARLVFLANPDNPSGSMQNQAEVRALLEALPLGCLLLLDEAYVEFADEALCLPTTLQADALVRLRTFSKAYGLAGARVGYMVARPDLVSALDRIRLHFGVAKISQEVALAAHGDTGFVEEVVAAVRESNADYRRMARSLELSTLPSSANFVAFDLQSPERAAFLERWFDQHDVFIRRPPVPPFDRLVRVTAAPAALRAYFGEVLASGMVAMAKNPTLRDLGLRHSAGA